MSKITRLQRNFALEYFADPHDATAAARRAGYAPGSAKVQAHRLLQLESVRTLIVELGGKVPRGRPKAADAAADGEDETMVSRGYIIQRLKQIAESQKTSESGRLKALAQLQKFAGFGAAGGLRIDSRPRRAGRKKEPKEPAGKLVEKPRPDDDGMAQAIQGATRH